MVRYNLGRALATVASIVICLGRPRPAFNRGIADSWYKFAYTSFSFGFLFSWFGYSAARSPEKKSLALVLLMVNFVAGATYFLQQCRLTLIFKNVAGHPVDIARYLEWFSCCPVLINIISEVTKTPHHLDNTMTHDYIMLTFGLIGSLMREPYSYLSTTMAVATFTVCLIGLWNMYTEAIEGKSGSTLDNRSLKTARFFTILCWCCFPIIWHFQKTFVVSFGTGEALYVLSDFGAKLVLTLILINASVEQSQNEKVDAIATLATQMEAEMSNTEQLLEKMMPAG